ncbi:calmodulin-interacting protein 111 isoform X1 [Tanacetum coccineum]
MNDTKRIRYKQACEVTRKDVERVFGMLKKKWAIIKTPAQPMSLEKILDMLYACIILHNYKRQGGEIFLDLYPEEQHHDELGDDVDINTLTMEQYLALIRDDIRPGMVKPEIGHNVEFKINSNSMKELRRKLFAGTDDEDAHKHVRRVLEIVDLFQFHGVTHDAVMLRVFPITLKGRALRWKKMLLAGVTNTWDLLEKEFIWQYCSPFKTVKKLKEIRNFKQEMYETLYQAWERGFITLMTPTQALKSIQVMADHSHNWYDEAIHMERINDSPNNVDAIQASFKGAHLTKECPLKKEDKAVEQSKEKRTTMGKGNIKEPVPRDLLPILFLGLLKEQIGENCKGRGTYDIPLHDGVMQPLTPQTVHIIPPDDDYVAPATNLILDKQLNDFGEEFSDITKVSEKENDKEPSDLNELCGYVLWKPSRDITGPLGPPSGLKGLLHMLNATVIPTKVKCKYVTRNTGKGHKNEENTDSYEGLRRNTYDSVTPMSHPSQHYGVTWLIRLDRLQQSRVQILWGMFKKKNVDYAELLWEDFQYQIDYRQINVMLNNDIKNSKAYQTYLAISTSIVSLKKARKGMKTTVVPKKKGSIIAKKLTSDEGSDDEQERRLIRRISTGVVIRDTPNVSKKKTLDETQKLKGIKLLSDATQLALDTQKAIKASKRDIRTQQQFGGSSEGVGITPEVLDELKGKSTVSSEGAGITPEVPDETKGKTAAQADDDDWGSKTESKIEWLSTDDEKKTDDDKVHSDDEVHEEETRDDEEMQDDDEEKKDDDKSEAKNSVVCSAELGKSEVVPRAKFK